MPRGGQMNEAYPASNDNHFEGILLNAWQKNKCGVLKDATEEEVVHYVSLYSFQI